jgi:cbb3-type cytochrome oxidase subunit 3
MPEVSREVVALLTYLLPGFLVAWLFYALTSHQKPSQQERVIQALIFTLLVHALVVVEKLGLEFVGRWVVLGAWDTDVELIASVFTALMSGLAVAYLTNKDTVHRHLRRIGLSKRSALPNEWCTVFSPREQFVVVHLKDDRRLYGWPKVWPSEPDKGHLFLTFPSWVHGEIAVELTETEGILLDVKDISHIEFVKSQGDC